MKNKIYTTIISLKAHSWLDNCRKSINKLKQKIKMENEEVEKEVNSDGVDGLRLENTNEVEKVSITKEEIVSKCLELKTSLDGSEVTEESIKEMEYLVQKIIERPSAPASLVHRWWKDMKETEGWIFGEIKSIEDKTHNLLVNFVDLSEEAQEKVVKLSDLVKSLI